MADSSVLSARALNVAEGVPVELRRLRPAEQPVARETTGADGRAGDPLLPRAAFAPGRYELRFGVGECFRRRGLGADPPFHDAAPVRIFFAEGRGHRHAPLLCSPWRGHTTCCGS